MDPPFIICIIMQELDQEDDIEDIYVNIGSWINYRGFGLK